MKGFPVRPVPVENVGVAAKAVARRQAEQLTVVRRRAQPTAVYIARLTATAVFAYLIAQALPGGSPRSVLAPLTALLVVQATLFNTIGTAIRRVAAVTVGVLAAVAVAAYVPFSWWVLGLLVAGTLALGIVLRLREEILEVPISAMLIFSVGSQAAASTRITETLVGAAAGLAAGLVFAPVRVQPAKEAVGELSRQMADLLGQMAEGLAETPDPRRAAEWLDRTRALRGEIERVDDALSQAEESVRLNPRRLRVRRPGGRPAGRRRHAGAGRDGRAGAGSFGGRQRAARQRAQPGQGGRDPGPAGRRHRGAFRRGAGLRPAARGRAGGARACRVRGRADHRGARRPPRGGPAAAGPARRPALHQPGRTAGGMAAARRDPLPRGPAALRARALPPARAAQGQAAAAGPAAEGAARAARPATERTAPQRVASGSGRGGCARGRFVGGAAADSSATGPRRRPNRNAMRVRARRTASRARARRSGSGR